MFLNNTKRFAALYFLILLFVCSTTVFSQDADGRQSASSERQSKPLKTDLLPDDKIVSGEIFDRPNPEDESSNYSFRPNIKTFGRNDQVIFERGISEICELKTGADVFAAPYEKLNAGSNRFRELSVDDSARNPRLVSQPAVFVEKSAPCFPSAVSLTYKFFLFNRKTSRSENAQNIRSAASETPGADSFNGNSFNNDDEDAAADTANKIDESFRWRSATGQTLMFLAIQHGYAFTQPKTREAIKGKFWKDYAKSVKSLHGWADGGRFFTNYIAHPMQGAFLGYIQVQNDPKGLRQQFGTAGDYWRSRLKAMAWSAAWSTQFEIGPVSQASIGNVGLKGKQTYIDIVVTPTVGTAWLIGEGAVDRLVMKRIERSTDNFYAVIFSRMLLSPTRTIANVFRFKTPWYRDRPRAR